MNAEGALTLSVTGVLLRLGLATLLGGAIGLERERLDRAAGLRTHAVVSLAAALFMLVSAYSFPEAASSPRVAPHDPTRIAAQVVSGIGFLGGGIIFLRKNTVRGLTTAASIWTVAGIGLAAGSGLYVVAAAATGFTLLVQAGLRPIEYRLFYHSLDHHLVLRVERGRGRLAAVEAAVAATNVSLRQIRVRPLRGGSADRVELDLRGNRSQRFTTLLDTLRDYEGVRVVSYHQGSTVAEPSDSADGPDTEAREDGNDTDGRS